MNRYQGQQWEQNVHQAMRSYLWENWRLNFYPRPDYDLLYGGDI